MNKTSLPLLLVITVIAGSVFGFVYQKYGATTNTNTISNRSNTNTTNSATALEAYPTDVMQDYLVEYNGYSPDAGRPKYGIEYLTSTVVTPFKRSEYHGTITSYGILFWKKGPTKTTTFPSFGTTPMEYEAGIAPDFRWYDFRTKKFSTLPTRTWNAGVATFDRVYDIHASSTEPKILIEVGEYDIANAAFEPGLVDGQPVKTRGVIFNPRTTLFEAGDPIQQFHTALKRTTTMFSGFHWDSKNQAAIAVPGGEGCGAYDTISFIQLKTGVVTTYGGEGKQGFAKGICNPRNGISSDGKWAVLYGDTSTTAGQAILYNVITAQQEKVVKTVAFGDENWVSTWNTKQTLPILTTAKKTIIDFNK